MKSPYKIQKVVLVIIGILLVGCIGVSMTKSRAESEQKKQNSDEAKQISEKASKMNPVKKKKLTAQEAKIILHKGTEPPFSGKYANFFEKGVYTCKQCGAKLFISTSKFRSQCGWPSFDEQIPGAVRLQPDADGVRTEIVCEACDGHLGHIFFGEKLTPKNTRYCVNSLSLDFTPMDKAGVDRAIFAAGCFWGVEYHLKNIPGVLFITVGYTGGNIDKPTYKQVCTDKTGHAEAVEVLYDPNVVDYEKLAKVFFEIHDFTQLNRQGPDIGTQYRSAIFYVDEGQKKTALKLIDILRLKGHDVKTQIAPSERFWPAEDYHQDYYQKTGKLPYCHTRRKVF